MTINPRSVAAKAYQRIAAQNAGRVDDAEWAKEIECECRSVGYVGQDAFLVEISNAMRVEKRRRRTLDDVSPGQLSFNKDNLDEAIFVVGEGQSVVIGDATGEDYDKNREIERENVYRVNIKDARKEDRYRNIRPRLGPGLTIRDVI